jgi:hypothetical protein
LIPRRKRNKERVLPNASWRGKRPLRFRKLTAMMKKRKNKSGLLK